MNLFAWSAEWIWWSLLAVGFTASLTGVLVWYFREVSRRRLPAPRFFLIALTVHVLLGIGSFYVYLDNGTGAQIRHGLRQIVAAAGIPLQKLRQSLRPADDGFGKVADLKSVTTESPVADPSPASQPPRLASLETAPLEPLGPMLPAARFAAPPGELTAGADIRNLPRHRAAVGFGTESAEIEPLRAAGQPSAPRIEGVAVAGGDRAAAAGPPPAAAMLAGLAEPVAGSLGKGTPTELAMNDFSPAAITSVPRMNRAARLATPAVPEVHAELEVLSAPVAGSGHDAGSGDGSGQRAGVSPGVVDVSRPHPGSAPTPRGVPGGSAGDGDAVALADWSRRLGQGAGGGAFQGDGGQENSSPSGTAAGGLPQNGLARRGPRSSGLMYAEDAAIGLQAMFRMRQSEDKLDVATAAGGTSQSLVAVHLGLKWFVDHQHANGYWSLHEFYRKVPGRNYGGQGGFRCDVAATGFALLPLLGDGHTHLSGEYQLAVRRGLAWMLTQQKPDGELSGEMSREGRMYTHGIAAIVLCEAYGMTKDPKLQDPAQRALDFIVAAQHQPSGGWRYNPRQEADTSVVGWQVMAMKSGQMAALKVPQATLDRVQKWLRANEGKGADIGTFRYQPGYPFTPAMTAEGLLCLEYLGTPRDDPRLQSGVKYLLRHLPRKGQESSYYWYYGTQVMYHVQGEAWRKWNLALRDMLVQSQIKSGHLAGTWDPADQWDWQAGRIYASSLRLLALEVYFRHLPLYRLSEP
jgi:hypothetical protein